MEVLQPYSPIAPSDEFYVRSGTNPAARPQSAKPSSGQKQNQGFPARIRPSSARPAAPGAHTNLTSAEAPRVRMGIVNSLMAQPLGSSHLRPSELLAAAPNPSRSRRPLSAKSPERIKVRVVTRPSSALARGDSREALISGEADLSATFSSLASSASHRAPGFLEMSVIQSRPRSRTAASRPNSALSANLDGIEDVDEDLDLDVEGEEVLPDASFFSGRYNREHFQHPSAITEEYNSKLDVLFRRTGSGGRGAKAKVFEGDGVSIMNEYSKKYQAEFDAIYDETSAALSRLGGGGRGGKSRWLDPQNDNNRSFRRTAFVGSVKGMSASGMKTRSTKLPTRGGLASPARSPRGEAMLKNKSVQGRLDARMYQYKRSLDARNELKRRVKQIFAERRVAYGADGFVEVNKKAVAVPADPQLDQLEASIKARERARKADEVRLRARLIEEERQRQREERVASRADRAAPSRPASALAQRKWEGGATGAAQGGRARPASAFGDAPKSPASVGVAAARRGRPASAMA